MQIIPEVKQWQLAMRGVKDGMPRAIAGAINRVSALVEQRQALNVRRAFVLRNQYTMRSLRRFKASPKPDVAKINAIVGSISPYMPLQDEGGERRPVKGKHVPVPTKAARGGSWDSPILRKFALRSSMQFGKAKLTKSGRRSKAAGVFFVLPKGQTMRTPAIFMRVGRQLIKIRILAKASYQLKPTKWHREANEKYGTLANMEKAFITEARQIIGGN